VQAGVEECDDGNLEDADGCSGRCQAEVCGNGRVDAGEACDDGNEFQTDACLNSCVAASCGDGHVRAGVEECDDNNQIDGDGCAPSCRNECRYIDFDGIDDRAAIPNHTQTGERTLEVWIQGLDAGENVRVSMHSMALVIVPGILTAQAFIDGNGHGDSILYDPVAMPIAVNTQLPMHVAAVYRGQQIEIFVNGISAGRGGRAHNQSTINNGCAGAFCAQGRDPTEYRSRIRSIRFSSGINYTQPFTPEIELTVQPQTLILYRARDAANGTIVEASGRHGAATLHGTPVIEIGFCR
jgi:cysteine-rich repeat protein